MHWQTELNLRNNTASLTVGESDIYLTGSAITSGSYTDAWIAKLRKSNGSLRWSKQIGDSAATSSESISGATLDSEGNLQVMGTYGSNLMHVTVSPSDAITVMRVGDRSGRAAKPVIWNNRLYFLGSTLISGYNVSTLQYINLTTKGNKSITISRQSGATSYLTAFDFAIGPEGLIHVIGSKGYNGAVGIHYIQVDSELSGYGPANSYHYYSNTKSASIPAGAKVVLNSTGKHYVIASMATTSGSVNSKSLNILTHTGNAYGKLSQIGAFYAGSSNLNFIHCKMYEDRYIYVIGTTSTSGGGSFQSYLFKFDVVSKTLVYRKRLLFNGADAKITDIDFSDSGVVYISISAETSKIVITAFESESAMLGNTERGITFVEAPTPTLRNAALSEQFDALSGIQNSPTSYTAPTYRVINTPLNPIYSEQFVLQRVSGFICGG